MRGIAGYFGPEDIHSRTYAQASEAARNAIIYYLSLDRASHPQLVAYLGGGIVSIAASAVPRIIEIEQQNSIFRKKKF